MNPFLGEIRMMPYANGFVPRGWALCDGTLMQVQRNPALFSLIGVKYGGNGQTTFALPDLRGRAVVGIGQGPGLSNNYVSGQQVGTESVPLLNSQLPAHTHGLGTPTLPVSDGPATTGSPIGTVFAKVNAEAFGPNIPNGPMAADLLSGQSAPAGANQPHENRMPFLAMRYFIAVEGEFPQRQ